MKENRSTIEIEEQLMEDNKWLQEDFKNLSELNLTDDEWTLLYTIQSIVSAYMLQNELTKNLFYEDWYMFSKFLSKLYWIDKNRKENNNE